MSGAIEISSLPLLRYNNLAANFLGPGLIIDCPKIILTQLTEKDPQIFTASGSIRISQSEGVQLRILIPRIAPDEFDPLSNFSRIENLQQGVLIPKDYYFRLEATDVHGTIWKCDQCDPRIQESEGLTVVSIATNSIYCTLRPSFKSNDSIEFAFVEDFSILGNVAESVSTTIDGKTSRTVTHNIHKGETEFFDFAYQGVSSRGDRPYSFFSCVSKSSIDREDIEELILDAFQFCTATLALPFISQSYRNGTLTLRFNKVFGHKRNGLLGSPLHNFKQEGFSKYFKVIFGAYFKYLFSAPSPDAKKIHSDLLRIYSVGDSYLPTIALVLSVTVESFLKNSRFKFLAKNFGENGEDLQTIKSLIQGSGASENLRGRIIGFLKSMNNPSSSDLLHRLEGLGVISRNEVKAWKKLRHPSAHGSLNVEESALQDIMNDIHKVSTLVYKLVFLIIGYSGKYHDRSDVWSIRDFDATKIDDVAESFQSDAPPALAGPVIETDAS